MSDERVSLVAIDDKLAEMWRSWKRPASFSDEVVKPPEAAERNELAHAANHDLGDKLEAVQQERDRLHALQMEGQTDLDAAITALGESVELLRTTFLARLS